MGCSQSMEMIFEDVGTAAATLVKLFENLTCGDRFK